MSTHIIYKIKCVRVPGALIGSPADLFAFMTLGGASNTYSGWGANARRCRDWGMAYLGTESDIVALAIAWGHSVHGHCIVWGNMGPSGRITVQQWITKVRRALRHASELGAEHLDSTMGTVDDLCFVPTDAFSGKSIREVLACAIAETSANPGSSTWQFLRVLGPGKA